MNHSDLFLGLAIDGVAVALLAYVIYYRRHWRSELLVAFTALNLGVFAAVALLITHGADLALGFGLFGILSIVRLRSSALSQTEVGYYFVALTLGLINALGSGHLPAVLGLDAVLLGVMYALDRPRLGQDVTHRTVTLDVVHDDEASLRADLERRLGAQVLSCDVAEVDYVRDVTVCGVRARVGPRVAGARR